jgi:hypothetical protein
MIIFIGGFMGSGRFRLANELGRRPGFHLYKFHEIPLRRLDSIHGIRSRRALPAPITDDERSAYFKGVVNDLPMLVKMHTNVILSEPFHRTKPREILFEAARKLGPILVVWVDAADDIRVDRMSGMHLDGRGLKPETALQMRQDMQKDFEPFNESVIRFTFKNTSESSGAFCDLIEKEMTSSEKA